MTFKELEKVLLSKPGAKLDYPFGEETAVYKVGDKMFAIMPHNKTPVNISLKCDPNRAASANYSSTAEPPALKQWISLQL